MSEPIIQDAASAYAERGQVTKVIARRLGQNGGESCVFAFRDEPIIPKYGETFMYGGVPYKALRITNCKADAA